MVFLLTVLDCLRTVSTANLSIPKECTFSISYSSSAASFNNFSCFIVALPGAFAIGLVILLEYHFCKSLY
jgi:hypothetical protein